MSFNSKTVAQLFTAFISFSILSSQTLIGQQAVAPESIVGRDTCAQCHGAEFKAWEQSYHNKKAWSRLEHPKAEKFAKALGVTDIKGNSICTQCHGTHQTDNSQLIVLPGGSCESCHGGAGGTNGWLSKHYDFGQGRVVKSSTKMADLLADRLKETEAHRIKREADCASAGMNRTDNTLAIAKNCLRCHLVPSESLLKAGHPISSSFELVEWSNGKIRHNFLLDGQSNNEAPTSWLDEFRHGPGRTVDGHKRLTFLAGKLADLEVSLRIRSGVTSVKRGTLGDEMNDRILDIQDELNKLALDSLQDVVMATNCIDKDSLRAITDQDQSLYNDVADAVANAAVVFTIANADGSQLPDSIKIRDKVKGTPYRGD